MPADTALEPPDFRAIFNELTGLYLLLSPELTILAASKAYLDVTHQNEDIIGAYLFDRFPDSDANHHKGAGALARSLERVLESGSPDAMPLQRYDLVLADGTVEERYWSPINTPIFDASGRLRWLLHRVSDVTAAVLRGVKEGRIAELEGELLYTAKRLSRAYDDVRASEARLRLALEVGGMAVWRFRLRDEALSMTPELNRLIGLKSGHPTTLEEVRSGFVDGELHIKALAYEAWSKGRSTFERQFRYRRHDDGRMTWLLLRAEILCMPEGAPTELLGVLQDVGDAVAVQERQRTLINELNHRVKNNLTLVQSLALRTFRGQGCDDALGRFIDRLLALAATHDLLTQRDWQGAELAPVIGSSLAGLSVAADRWRMDGPAIDLGPDLAVAFSLAIHELGTNAVKYGALSNEEGRIEITWFLEAPSRLVVLWQERGGPEVRPPQRQGFGSQLLARVFSRQGGHADLDFAPQGLLCRIEVSLA